MKQNVIPIKLKRYREAKNVSMRDLAERSGLPYGVYREFELGQTDISIANFHKISSALGVPVQKLTSPSRELRNVRFRSNQKMKERKLVLLEVEHWLNEFEFIEDILNDHLPYKLSHIGKQLNSKKNKVELAANLVRKSLGLNKLEPVRNVCGWIESCGVKVHEMQIPTHDFFGLSVGKSDGGPAIIINTWSEIPVERWIFTAVHELGHLVLHQSDFNVNQTIEEKVHEKEANTFASEFLMPNESFLKKWSSTYGLSFVDRVMIVKRFYQVSFRTVLYRLSINDSNGENYWARFQSEYKRWYNKSLLQNEEPDSLANDAFRASFPEQHSEDEPDKLSPTDFKHNRLVSLVRKALEEEKLGIGRGAEILDLSLEDMRQFITSCVD